ncbi:peptidase domain-containing ABC transporter [Bradyrhizobium sp. WSM471]|uniref:peptidase domain-containing ABC transporter n=1 Tax=Bradyrhizobium sp. WSM471 TaxID=319017 RepID=UPI00024D21B6|nr:MULTISPECIES: peptidase domain-containing ABC transporter [Bradyrhizobium]EHR01325.1 ABC-type bacteriocin/lantibiotic exporter with N-terminal double-glycine peptidase domain [Bradyrhizobium sp. WSM471]UFW43385.1 peptidase domain-containing ABC transporter [Bradyrhizobium canariense]
MSSELVREGASTDPTPASALECLVIVARQHGMHLTPTQLVQDNLLRDQNVSIPQLIKCAENAGMKAKAVKLDWAHLAQLKKALPAVVWLRNGAAMVLLSVDGDPQNIRVTLRDPNAADDALLVIDQPRFEDIWSGDVVLVKRDYEISDEDQPFSFGLITSLIFRERRMVRDVAIAALVLGFLSLAPIMFWRLMSDKVIFYKAYNTFYVLCVGMLVVIAFEAAFSFLRQFLVHRLTSRLDVKLSTYVFEKVLSLPIDYFEQNAVGLISRDIREVFRVRTFLVGQLFGTVLDSTMLLFFLPVMFFFSPVMTFIVLGFAGLIVAWLVLMLPAYRKKSGAVMAAEGAQGAFLIQSLNGIRTIKSLALDARQRHMWDVLVARVAKARIGEAMTGTMIQTVVRPLERLAVSGSYAIGVYLALTTNDPIYIGAMFAFLMLSQRVSAPLMQMAQLINQYDEARTAVATVGKLVNQPAEEGRSGHGVRTPFKGQVEFSGVTFKYKGTVTPALNDVSFEIPQGQTLGIMGKSGSGKTTITRLLQRLHSDYGGLIKIDGIDVREYDVDHLRRNVGVVLQENFLFSGTIRENIAAAKPDATFDEVVRAARLAGAEEFIDKLPRGYETYIYEGSPNLSGGQRQRLAIARALIVDPPILILDEATSALDADSEAIVNANIARIAHGRTLIVISHRLSSLVKCDAIVVLNRGVIDDVGRHEELLERNDIYSGLWHQQNNHMIAPVRRSPSLVS